MTDKSTDGEARPRTRAQERADAVSAPSRVELLERNQALEQELEQARAQADEHLRNWQRTAADFSNYRRRTDEERSAVAQLANAVLIGKLLAVLDDFDRALENVPAEAHESWVEGVRLVDRKLRGVLEGEGVTPIDVVGQPFDPNVAEAVVHQQTTDYPDNQVIDELQRGYRMHDRVIRPALVRVANNPKEH
ncbi:MAG TPA: nucleotide exchange factor GrpE [Candidatus Limnocylindria bacterium]|jgi:molecular chaperone GrpE|nr:nucleotide exchange factor GrpE [Candidatus Limnocylindria bacterium]